MKIDAEMKHYFRFFCNLLLTVLVTGMFVFVWTRFLSPLVHSNTLEGYTGWGTWLVIHVLLYCIMSHSFHGTRIGVERLSNIIAAQIITLTITNMMEFLISILLIGQWRHLGVVVLCFIGLLLAQSFAVSLIVFLMVRIYIKIFPALQIIEVYGDYENNLCQKVNVLKHKYHVREHVRYDSENLRDRIAEYDAVLINDIPDEKRNKILKYCFNHNKRVYFIPKISDILVKQSERLNLIDTPMCLNRNNGISRVERFFKRVFDIVSSAMLLIIASPIFAVTAIAIKLNDGGPVFFRQERCTINCKKFMILKFRSMIVDAEKDGKSHPAGEYDDRITKVGRVIRATRIDELPQLINILKGDMSVVGPRPERVEHVEHYTEMIPEFSLRSKVKGGLTGYAQVFGKYNTTALDKLKMDLIYVTNFSLLLDLQIIIETFKILFRKESTEGFSEERAKEMHDA